jgi:hypothetical protein
VTCLVWFLFFYLISTGKSSAHCAAALSSSTSHPYHTPAYHNFPSNPYVPPALLSNPFLITNFFTEPRRAAVALIIRVVPSPSTSPLPQLSQAPPTLPEFFDLDWVKHPDARPEILFLRRDNPSAESDASLDVNNRLRNNQEAHVAFPGGRTEEGDEGGLYTGEPYLPIVWAPHLP